MQEWGDGQGIALPTKPNPSGDDLQLVAWQQLAKSGWNRIISELNSIEQYPGFSVFLDFLWLIGRPFGLANPDEIRRSPDVRPWQPPCLRVRFALGFEHV